MKPHRAPTVPPQRPGAALALVDRVKACQLCSDLPLGPRPILQLDPAARILIASQAPGRKAHASGVPFDDPSGDRLRNWLGVGRDQFYDPALFAILPLGMCYPGTGAQGDLAPRPLCAATWRAGLMDALRDLRLTLAIGRHAMAWHAPASRAVRLAEVVRMVDAGTMVLPHPSPRNNRWLKANPWFEEEILPLLRTRIAAILA